MDSDFFDLVTDRFKLVVGFRDFHLSEALQLLAHLDKHLFLFFASIQSALLFNFSEHLWLDQVHFEVHFDDCSVLLYQEADNVTGFLSKSVAAQVKRLKAANELEPLAKDVASLIAELVLAQVNVLKRQLVVLQARPHKLLDAVHFDAVSSQVQRLQLRVLC